MHLMSPTSDLGNDALLLGRRELALELDDVGVELRLELGRGGVGRRGLPVEPYGEAAELVLQPLDGGDDGPVLLKGHNLGGEASSGASRT